MGQEQSRGRDDGAAHESAATSQRGGKKVDYYDVLEVEPTASSEDIRKAYRRQALIWHPDKNAHRIQEANDRFTTIGLAYEVLSDPQERAWYDGHKDQILGDVDEAAATDWSPRSGQEPPAKSSTLPGLTSSILLKFFDASIYSGYGDDSKSFFTIYRQLFERLASEEEIAAPYPGESQIEYSAMPNFGAPSLPHDSAELKAFYNAWLSFSTRKSFSWADKYRLGDAADRRIKRLMEKENKKCRENAKRDYSATVRDLVLFVRRRDPRWKMWLQGAAAREDQQRSEKALRAHQQREKMREGSGGFVEQDWMIPGLGTEELGYSDEEGQSDQDSDRPSEDESDAVSVGAASMEKSETGEIGGQDAEAEPEPSLEEEIYCAACTRSFSSVRQKEDHEKSKKHREAVRKLTRELKKEEATFEYLRNAGRSEEKTKGRKTSARKEGPPANSEREAKSNGSPGAADPATSNGRSEEAIANGLANTQLDPLEHSPAEQELSPSIDRSNLNAAKLKREKRRQKTAGAAPITPGSNSGATHSCNVCSTSFGSRTKLFDHIKSSGHALASSEGKQGTVKKSAKR